MRETWSGQHWIADHFVGCPGLDPGANGILWGQAVKALGDLDRNDTRQDSDSFE